MNNENIFQRLQSGEVVPFNDPQYSQVSKSGIRTTELLIKYNNTSDPEKLRSLWRELTGVVLDPSSYIQIPVMVNHAEFVDVGKGVYINHGCTMLALGTIKIEDNVLIGPKANLISEGHPVDPASRRSLEVKPVVIKKNAWLGAGVTILSGVTVGENAVVAAGAVVNKDVPANTVVVGVPAKVIRRIN